MNDIILKTYDIDLFKRQSLLILTKAKQTN